MFDMINIFEVFLPQLLRYPNPTDPLNGEAAALLMRDPKNYEAKVKGTSPPFNFTPVKKKSHQQLMHRIRDQIRHQRRRRRSWRRQRIRKRNELGR